MPRMLGSMFLIFLLGMASGIAGQSESDARGAIIGRWDITVNAGAQSYPSWLEVRKSGRAMLVGSFVGRSGSARPISKIEFADGADAFFDPAAVGIVPRGHAV